MQKTIVIQSSSDDARKLCREIVGAIIPNDFSQKDIFEIQLAIEEAMVNAVEHGNGLDAKKKVTIKYSITPREFEISITDEGCGFRPESLPDPTNSENIQKPCGRGVLLMRACMSSVEYNKKGNCVRMVKYPSGTKSNS